MKYLLVFSFSMPGCFGDGGEDDSGPNCVVGKRCGDTCISWDKTCHIRGGSGNADLDCGDAGNLVCASDDAGVESCSCEEIYGEGGYGGAGGLLMDEWYDLPNLPAEPTFKVEWTDSGVDLTVIAEVDSGPYLFGMAGIGDGAGGWYGEDCLDGMSNGRDICHRFEGLTLHLDSVGLAGLTESQSTLFTEAQQDSIAYVVARDNPYEDHKCWVFGRPGYYNDLGCKLSNPGQSDPQIPEDLPFQSESNIDIFVDAWCNMDVRPAGIHVPSGQFVQLTWHNRSVDYPVDVWLSYGGEFPDLEPGAEWSDRFEFCHGEDRPYQAGAIISTPCSDFRFLIYCD